MTDFITDIRNIGGNLADAIVSSAVLYQAKNEVMITLVTDKAFTSEERESAQRIARNYVPERFTVSLDITKLTPDCDMVKEQIKKAVAENYKAASALLTDDDIVVEKGENGFTFTISLFGSLIDGGNMAKGITDILKTKFCGNFYGKCVQSQKTAEDIEVEEEHENIEYIEPPRTFSVCDFQPIESTEAPKLAIYCADINFEGEKVVVCGRVDSIVERKYTRQNGQEKNYYVIQLNDGSAALRVTYFARLKTIEKIRAIKEGDSIVCTGKSELYNGSIRYTANLIDYGTPPKGFVPEKRKGKPVPKYYKTVIPQPYTDLAQADMFEKNIVPACLLGKSFVVFDLETTGLVSSPVGGNMDKIIEIGAFKVVDGIIKESFTTFVNPGKKLSEEIVKLTGINDDMIKDAPSYEQVMPDFVKFCEGSYLVGHNIVGFDFKFVDYYSAQCGYILERKLFDTLMIAQEQLFLSNYKLNTIADYFGITFNHHRAIDDALATAKIFLALIKKKNSLPNAC